MSDFIAKRDLPDGRMAVVILLTYGRGRLCVGPTDDYVYDDSW